MQDAGDAARCCIGRGAGYAALMAREHCWRQAAVAARSAIDTEIAKPALHVGGQDLPCKGLVLLRVAALATALVICSPDGK